jgi:hypothetical protein
MEIHKAQDDPNLLPFYDVKEQSWKSFYIYNIESFYTEEEIKKK